MSKFLQLFFVLGLFLITSLDLSAQVGLTGSVTYTNGTFSYDDGDTYRVCSGSEVVLTPNVPANVCSSNGGLDRAFYVTGTLGGGDQTEVVPAQPNNTVIVDFYSYYRYCVRCNDGTMFESDFIIFNTSTTTTEEGESCATSLPVELTSFKANNVDAGVALEWATGSELNNQGFEVEFSADARSFEKVDFVAGNGTTNQTMHYNFTHKTSEFGSLYYRLKQLDFDGAYEYSDIIEVNREKPNNGSIVISPNPAIGSAFTIRISNPDRLNSFVQVTDLLGKVIYSTSLHGDESPAFFEKEISSLTRQMYIVTTIIGTEVTINQVANVSLD